MHLYKRALAIAKPRKKHVAEDWRDGEAHRAAALATQPSDLELYERRVWYCFWPQNATSPSPYVPWKETPEEQVAVMSIYEFFRLVRFHGGRSPYLTWHDPEGREPSRMPIVMMSSVVKMREGPDFAFGARWALMQYHPWRDRQHFLGMDEAAIKDYFREWVGRKSDGDEAVCPFYVRDQYEQENGGRLRGVRAQGSPGRPAQPSAGDGTRRQGETQEGDAEHGDWAVDED